METLDFLSQKKGPKLKKFYPDSEIPKILKKIRGLTEKTISYPPAGCMSIEADDL